jgi:hypothetical protein
MLVCGCAVERNHTTSMRLGAIELTSDGVVETLPRLPGSISWVRIEPVPVFTGEVDVYHAGLTETPLLNESGGTIQWRAVFPGGA